jgi:prephenate dehydrogenase
MRPERVDGRFERVAILGMGLMGGSLARALAGLPAPPRVVGWSPLAGEREAALAAGAVAEAPAGAEQAVAASDLVVLATPLEAACRLVDTLAGAMAERAFLTDVASLKRPVLDAVRAAGLDARWVGAHPMCGSEASGFSASRADLYAGARVWLVADGAGDEAVERVAGFWRALGADPVRADADGHDHLMVLASHLPQLSANALARLLADAHVSPAVLGPGGRDMTRLAGSSPDVWRDLLAHAPSSLPGALRDLAGRLETVADMVEQGELEGLERWMAGTRAWRTGP